jgi:hypothetical protein
MLPLLPGGGAAPAALAQDLLDELYPLLGASASADLDFWTDAQLLAWLNAGLSRLARSAAVFVKRNTSISVEAGTAQYSLATSHLSTLHVSLDGALLRPATAAELEALSAMWQADVGTPARYWQDSGLGTATIGLYRKPIASGTLAVIEHEVPDAVEAGDPLPLPDPLGDYAFFYALAEARSIESDGAMPETAEICRQVCGLIEAMARDYWGVSQ